jgi:2-amino-4-hydroxy-6-hydroxymethyldihydropteridine diphosphokinase
MTQVAIAVGSNLGDRRAAIDRAVGTLAHRLRNPAVSPIIETEAVGLADQPRFLNGALVGEWDGTARTLLDVLQAVEDAAGRLRPFPGAARTLDLDLILFGSLVLSEPDLEVPHPRFRERAFVLEPLAEVGPEMVDPVTGVTVAELWQRLRARPAR